MDVTRSNFRAAYRRFEEDLEKCDFVAIDTEFTGVSSEGIKILPYDSPELAYRKYLDNTAGYIIIQLGVTLIQRAESEETPNGYTYNSYNFYICPRSWKTNFLCQASSMIFLAENGFNFNKVFQEGIPYCDEQEEKFLRERLREKHQQREESRKLRSETTKNTSFNHIPVPEEEKEAMDRIEKEIETFIGSQDEEKVIGGCNAFQRKLIYELIELKFTEQVSATTQNVDKSKVIVIHRRKGGDEEERIEKEIQRLEWLELEDNVGISKIVQKISSSRKPIIGHNMLLDIIFMLRQFFRPLPDNLSEFKKFAHHIFPYIIDTKCMCNLPDVKTIVKSSVLADLVRTISEPPFMLPNLKSRHPSFNYSLKNDKAHESGYDSFITAVSFLSLANYVHGTVDVLIKDINEAKDYLNRICMVKLSDVGFLNLVGIEPVPVRDHVFHVTVPEDWKQSDVVHHFRNYGPIYVTWINSTSALISLHKKENSDFVLKTIGTYDGFRVQSFNAYKETLQHRINGNDCTTTNLTRKRKLSEQCTPEEIKTVEKKMKTSSTSKQQEETNNKCPKQTATKVDTNESTGKVFRENNDW